VATDSRRFARGAIAKLRADRATVPQLMALAAQDTDPVSTFVDGTSWDDATGMILVVKGGKAAREIVEWLERQGLITPQKPVAP
jgi:hypothetical protein